MSTKQQTEIITTENYWDCECKTFYIHPKSDICCNKCGAMQQDQPDSRESEIKERNMAPAYRKSEFLNIKTAKFVEMTDLVPEGISDDFYVRFSEECDVSFGDANRTFTTIGNFFLIVQDVLEDNKDDNEVERLFLEDLEKLVELYGQFGDLYVDLEN